MTHFIGGIPADAPVFNRTPYMTLVGIVELLSKASYHYADDRAGEWGYAAQAKTEAAMLVNQNKLGATAIKALVEHQPQLVTLSDFIDAVLKDARK